MQNSLSTAAEQLDEARERLRTAEDAEWDEPTAENTRIVSFWTGQITILSGMGGDELIPLF